MKIDYHPKALKELEDAPANMRKAFFKQVKFLEHNLNHPSLRAKKYDEAQDVWQARVNKDWRFSAARSDPRVRIEQRGFRRAEWKAIHQQGACTQAGTATRVMSSKPPEQDHASSLVMT